jgi:hypothetical protein
VRVTAVHDQCCAIERLLEEQLVAFELQAVGHDMRRVREHAVRGDDDVAFDAKGQWRGYSETVVTTLLTGRVLTVGSLTSLSSSWSYSGNVEAGNLARIATTL